MTGDVPFDAITTFFVFLIGLPAIIFQWLAPEVRQIIVKRPVELLLDAGAPVVAGIAIVGIGLYTPNQWKWLWPTILAALFLLAIFTAFRIPRKYVRRTAVVSRLERQASRSSGATVRLVEPVLLDLIELGNQSQPGREKELVLQALLGLSESVCTADGYDGDQLLDVAFGVLDVVLNGPEAGSSQNLATASDILKQPLRALDAKGNWEFKQADLLHSIRA